MEENTVKKKQKEIDQYRYMKYRIFCWYMIIVFGILTIALSLLSLFQNISPIFAILSFVMEVVFTKLMEHFKTEKKQKEKE